MPPKRKFLPTRVGRLRPRKSLQGEEATAANRLSDAESAGPDCGADGKCVHGHYVVGLFSNAIKLLFTLTPYVSLIW